MDSGVSTSLSARPWPIAKTRTASRTSNLKVLPNLLLKLHALILLYLYLLELKHLLNIVFVHIFFQVPVIIRHCLKNGVNVFYLLYILLCFFANYQLNAILYF